MAEHEARAGDSDLADLYREHHRQLVKLAVVLLDDPRDCEDVVQDAFVRVELARTRLREPDRLPAYLRSAVLNGARSRLRRRDVRARLAALPAPEPPATEGGVLQRDSARAVLAALRCLPARQRDALVLRYWLELSEVEIAATLGVAPGTVKTHVKRGLEALARMLEAHR